MLVEVRDYKFLPRAQSAKPGDVSRWVNREKRASYLEASGLESERMFPDESWPQRFQAAGSYPHRCGHHPEMSGVIEVHE